MHEEAKAATTTAEREIVRTHGMVESGMEQGSGSKPCFISLSLPRKPREDRVMIESSPTAGATTREITITRVFDAPRELVWKAWTEPEHFMRWWGPKNFTAPFCTIDLRVGGAYLNCMRSPEGQDYWSTGIFREIAVLERIVYTDSFADEHGNVVPATHYGMSADIPREMVVTVTFEEHGGKTKLTLRHVGIPAGEMSDQTEAGWNESFDKLAEYLIQP